MNGIKLIEHGNFTALESALEGSVYEDDSRRRRHRTQTAEERRAAAIAAQAMSGSRVRIARSVKNQGNFADELKVWIPFVQSGVASRKSLGNLAMTVFDTAQQPLINNSFNQASVEEKLKRDCPALFKDSPRIEVTGTDLFGSRSQPFIGLTLAPSSVYLEWQSVRDIIAPELSLGDAHLPRHRIHVSLGQAHTHDHAVIIQKALQSSLPEYVQFKGARVSVTESEVDAA